MGSLHIDMLGTSFTVQMKPDDDYLKRLLNYYKDITVKISKTSPLNPHQVAILAGIMICDELYKEKSELSIEKTVVEQERQKKAERDELDSKIEKILSESIEKLDTAIL
ncbi:MAG: cell division protein ZapA [Treponema sp.]|nr:cell division protein ZapA [Treponema sp.]MBR4630049.1 cell division protein ZapA [Treponema sp.]